MRLGSTDLRLDISGGNETSSDTAERSVFTRPTFAIRLDVDTTTCARALPKVLSFADRFGIRFTIFVNVGRSVSFRGALDRRLRPYFSSDVKAIPKKSRRLPLHKKLGLRGVCETLLVNPRLFPIARDVLLEAKSTGHEIGLHGGTNHGLWQSYAATMSDQALEALLLPALEEFTRTFGMPFGFTSPGFVVHPHAYGILRRAGCHYVSDYVSVEGRVQWTGKGGLPNIPVTLAAEGNVDYLESYVAGNSQEPLEDVVDRFLSCAAFPVYYSHPCFVAGIGADVFTRFVSLLTERAECATMGCALTMVGPPD